MPIANRYRAIGLAAAGSLFLLWSAATCHPVHAAAYVQAQLAEPARAVSGAPPTTSMQPVWAALIAAVGAAAGWFVNHLLTVRTVGTRKSTGPRHSKAM
jgi:hypothetical protein